MLYIHNTVLLYEAVHNLNINPNGIYLDATFGYGGHSKLILSILNKNGKLISIDRDPEAIKIAKNIYDKRFTIIHAKFSEIFYYVKKLNLLGKINGIILDLGVSSIQLDNPQRGFSYMKTGLLDMRMDKTKGKSAMQWLNDANIDEITWVLKTFGEERFAKRIAKTIFLNNKKKKIIYTTDLTNLILKAFPKYQKKIHPARRSFQGIRIFINNELDEIKEILSNILKILSPNGRISVISFHSLEDRIIKKFIYKSNNTCIIPKNLPLTESQIFKINKKKIKFIAKIKPTLQEIKNNPRSKSAILRVLEKL